MPAAARAAQAFGPIPTSWVRSSAAAAGAAATAATAAASASRRGASSGRGRLLDLDLVVRDDLFAAELPRRPARPAPAARRPSRAGSVLVISSGVLGRDRPARSARWMRPSCPRTGRTGRSCPCRSPCVTWRMNLSSIPMSWKRLRRPLRTPPAAPPATAPAGPGTIAPTMTPRPAPRTAPLSAPGSVVWWTLTRPNLLRSTIAASTILTLSSTSSICWIAFSRRRAESPLSTVNAASVVWACSLSLMDSRLLGTSLQDRRASHSPDVEIAAGDVGNGRRCAGARRPTVAWRAGRHLRPLHAVGRPFDQPFAHLPAVRRFGSSEPPQLPRPRACHSAGLPMVRACLAVGTVNSG